MMTERPALTEKDTFKGHALCRQAELNLSGPPLVSDHLLPPIEKRPPVENTRSFSLKTLPVQFLDDRSTLEIFRRPQLIENTRQYLLLRTDISQKTESWVHLNRDLTGKLLVFWTGSRFSIGGTTIFRAYLINSTRFSEV